MSKLSYMYVNKEIPMLHSKLDDMSQNEAVLRYLQIVARLPDYGVHFFQVGTVQPWVRGRIVPRYVLKIQIFLLHVCLAAESS
jgi:hypothetical protein